MSKTCVVPGCGSAELRFFRFPTVKKSLTVLSEKRVEKWIRLLGFTANFDPDGHHVCELHFVSGTPAKDTDLLNVDWAPTLKVPNCSLEATENAVQLVEDSYSDSDSACENQNHSKNIDAYDVDWDPTLNVSKCGTGTTKHNSILNVTENAHCKSDQPSEVLPATSLCRACGNNLPDDPALSENFQDHAQIYQELFLVEPHAHEHPEQLRICLDCKNKLHHFEHFRDACIRFHWALLEVKTEPQDYFHEDDGTETGFTAPSFCYETTEQMDLLIKEEPLDNFAEENNDELKNIKSSESSFQPSEKSNADSTPSSSPSPEPKRKRKSKFYESTPSSSEDDRDGSKRKRKKKAIRKIKTASDEKQKGKLNQNSSEENKTRKKTIWHTPKPNKKSFQHQFDCHCPRKCPSNFTSERTLQQFYDGFWECKDKEDQQKLIISKVRAVPVSRARKKHARGKTERPDRDFAFHYFIPLDGEDVRVCQKFFLGILQINSAMVYKCIGRKGVNSGIGNKNL